MHFSHFTSDCWGFSLIFIKGPQSKQYAQYRKVPGVINYVCTYNIACIGLISYKSANVFINESNSSQLKTQSKFCLSCK